MAFTQRQRFLATMTGGDPDRFPFFDLEPAEETVRRWHAEGLPRGVAVAEHFRLETHFPVGVVLRSAPFYERAPDLLSDPKSFDRHYDPDDPDRYPDGLAAQCHQHHRAGRVVYVDACGGGLFQMLGVGDWDSLVAACVALKESPAMVKALLERTTDFYCSCLDRVLPDVTVDYASFYEPIADNSGPLISPAMFREFSIPVYRRLVETLRRFDVPLIIMCTTGGDLSPLLPDLLDAGINGLWISNIMSSRMEYVALRREYGNDIALIGGIDARALASDDTAVARAVRSTVPPLLEDGRYLPCLDDRPRRNIPFSRYRLYRDLLTDIAG